MRIRSLSAIAITTVLLLPCVAQTTGPKPPPVTAVTAQLIRDCPSISAGDRNLTPLSAVCEFVKRIHQTLPNFVCEQTTQRYRPIDSDARGSEERQVDDAVADTIRATVTYEGGVSRYSNIMIGEKPVQGEMFDVPGTTSIGEFGSELLSIFLQENAATFESLKTTKSLSGEDNYVFGVRISGANNHSWILREDGLAARPSLEGELWVSKETSKVIRLNIFVADLDKAFAADHIRVSTDFADVPFADAGTFLLPKHSETKLCTRNSLCMHNVTDWANCKRFAGKARIIFGME